MMDDELEQDRIEVWRAEWAPDYEGKLSPEELEYIAAMPDWLKERAEWELRDYTIERMEDFVNFFRNRANGVHV